MTEHEDCNVTESRCICILPRGHETPHVCDCGGTFQRVGDDLKVWRLPPGVNPYISVEDALERANEAARNEPLFIENVPAAKTLGDWMGGPRKPINFFKPPSRPTP